MILLGADIFYGFKSFHSGAPGPATTAGPAFVAESGQASYPQTQPQAVPQYPPYPTDPNQASFVAPQNKDEYSYPQ